MAEAGVAVEMARVDVEAAVPAAEAAGRQDLHLML